MNNPSSLEIIFFSALEKRSPAERMAFLDEACAGNDELRGSVERMLAAQAGVGSFLEQPIMVGDATVLHEPSISERPGTVIGPYKLLQQIGEGGMGVVFMAEQTEPIQRTVALKIIKPGMDTRQVIARFEAERQALAMMDHPNIAKVLDAGTTDSGLPYFVMELVKGVQITKYCDEKHLSLRERLELMLPVCQAVQHAHQKGIIHRDIKPSNVLVAEYDNHAAPKVIDFGVAKAISQKLTERTMFTEFGQVLGTMEYMSPEQSKLNQLDIDTRSDIYSLGVLLYELLTGSTPFEGKRLHEAAFDEMLRIIREEEPPKPSTRVSSSDTLPSIAANRHTEPARLSKDVRGELDWIVMKALEKDRDRRYDSANNLAADLERYLRNETVEAGPASAAYRLRKFVRRHKFGVAASAAIAAAVLAGITGTTYGLIWALRERKAAQASAALATTQAVRSEQVAQFLKDMLKGVAPSKALGRDTAMLREIVDTTAARIDKDLSDQPEVQIELRLILGTVYFDLQLYKEMEKNARRTLELAHEHLGEENLAVADALGQLGQALMFLRSIDEAPTVARQAIDMQRRLRGPDSLQESVSLLNLADILRHSKNAGKEHQKEMSEAETAARSALAIRRKVLGNECDETAWALHTFSIVLSVEGRVADCEATIREAYDIRVRLHGEEHPYTAADRNFLGYVLGNQGKLDEAESLTRKSLAIMERMDGKGKLAQANLHYWLAGILHKRGKPNEAEIEYREAIEIGKREVGSDYLDLSGMLAALAIVLAEQGKLTEARQHAEQAVDICQRHPEIPPDERRDAENALRAVMKKLGDASADKKD